MAAPVLRTFLCRALHDVCHTPHKSAMLPSCWAMHVRWKGKTSGNRAKQPHIAKQSDKWVQRKRVMQAKKQTMSAEKLEEFLSRKPTDNVWCHVDFPRPDFPLEQSLDMHKELAQPAMLDNMEGLVYLEMTLDMKTKKKTKFMSNIKSTVLLPHLFEMPESRTIIVFSKDPEQQQKARDMGATFVGGVDLINEVKDGAITSNEFKFCISTPDIIPELISIRTLLRDKFPMKQKGSVDMDVIPMMHLFLKGVTYESVKISESEAQATIPFGTLEMSNEDLVQNAASLLSAICEHRNVNLGPFVTKAFVTCPPSSERFSLNLSGYVPGLSSPELEEEDEEVIKAGSDSDDD